MRNTPRFVPWDDMYKNTMFYPCSEQVGNEDTFLLYLFIIYLYFLFYYIYIYIFFFLFPISGH